ncbi:MAG: hypothetical protein APF84_10995 [Gracilibacter sp. BRH_c7a]|nr:MAG: hypothetical protein APF84_10995 [Gracilibacter sp. BRH_c7a]
MKYFLRVNLTEKSIIKEDVPEKYQLYGGRLLTSSLINDEVDPLCDPIGPDNKLVLAAGLLGGVNIAGSGRLSAGAKSPLTGGIKESNAGGTFARRMSNHGLRAIILEGKSTEQNLVLEIRKDGITLNNYPDLKMKGVYDCTLILQKQYGTDWGICLIGPAGEMRLASACINNVDTKGIPSRVNGRGGLGSVMGSKGLKAIVVEPSPGTPSQAKKQKEIKEVIKEFTEIIQKHPMTPIYQRYGTILMTQHALRLGSMPCYNFRQGSMPNTEHLKAENLTKVIEDRGGEGTPTHGCIPGCIMKCSNIYPDKDGKSLVAPLEYENLIMLGPNIGITDVDQIAALNYIANDLGVDTIEIGAALGVAMDCGVLNFNDYEQARSAMEGIYQGTVLGRLLGQGAYMTGKILGATRIPVVKGQSMAAYDPRTFKGIGVTYATSPMGADHTAGHTLRFPVDHHQAEGQIEASLNAQKDINVYDSLGLCNFTLPQTIAKPEVLAALVSNYYDVDFDTSDLRNIGTEVIRTEYTFNRRAGFTNNDDCLPDFMLNEPLPPTNKVFDVNLAGMKNIYKDILK